MFGSSRTIRSLRRKRKANVHAAGPFLLAVVAVGMMLLLWGLGALVMGTYYRWNEKSSTDGWDNVLLLDLWPDSTKLSKSMENWLESCFPRDDPKTCSVKQVFSDTGQLTVGILRLPGKLGIWVEEYSRELLQSWDVALTGKIHLVASSNANPGEKVAQYIRVVALPPVLEALDLILQTFDVGTDSSAVSVEELQAVLQQVIRWHCDSWRKTQGVARMTILLDEAVVFPKVVGEDFANFLGLSYDNNENTIDSLGDMSVQLLHRLGEISKLARTIFDSRPGIDNKDQWVNDIVSDEIQRQSQNCFSPVDVFPKTRVTELTGVFLSGTSSVSACQSYPHSKLCAEAMSLI